MICPRRLVVHHMLQPLRPLAEGWCLGPFGIYAGNSAVAANGVQLVARARPPNELLQYSALGRRCCRKGMTRVSAVTAADCSTSSSSPEQA